MNTAPGFIAANWAAPKRPRDSSVSGTCTDTTSAPSEERVEGVRAVDPGGHRGGGEIRVEGRDAHPEATGDAGDMPRDPAEADQAQDLAVELDPLVAAVVAARGTGPERALGGLHVLGDEQHQGDGMLGRRDGRPSGVLQTRIPRRVAAATSIAS